MMLIISLGGGGAPETTNACISAAAAMIFPFSVWGLGKCNFPLPSLLQPSGCCLALFGFQIKLEESVWSECGLLGQSAASVMLVCECVLTVANWREVVAKHAISCDFKEDNRAFHERQYMTFTEFQFSASD